MFEEELEVVKTAVFAAGESLKKYYGSVRTYKQKEDFSLVSAADHAAEDIIFNQLRAKYPISEFLGEESGKTDGGTNFKRRFACDPLDGTTNFLYGLPHFCSSVGMAYEGQWVLGVIYNPITEDLFTAIQGKGAFYNGKKMQASHLENSKEAMVAFGRAFSNIYNQAAIVDLFQSFSKVRGVRSTGSAALDLAYVADGRFDLLVCKGLNVWDTAAACVLLKEAGARVCDFNGNDYQPEEANVVAGSTTLVSQYLPITKKL